MGGKEGKASTQMQIPDWLNTSLKQMVGGGLDDYDAFRKKGMEMIMPPEGQTNVNVRNPWDIVGMPGGDDPGAAPPVVREPEYDPSGVNGPHPDPPDTRGGNHSNTGDAWRINKH